MFAFGGGTSDDEHLREEGVTWWKNEMPDDTEYERAIQNLAAHHNEIDYIVTHDMSTSCLLYTSGSFDSDGAGRISSGSD